MTSILSVVLAIMMALTGMCGTAAKDGQPVFVEAGIVLDGDLSILMAGSGDQAEQMAPAMEALKSLLNALTIRFAADSSTAQMDILLNGTSAASLSAKAEEDGWAVVSSLFPTSMLTVKNETLAQFNTTPVIEDPEAMAEAVKAPVEQLISEFKATAGEPETGSWTVGGVEYTAKTVYNITTKEAIVKVLTTAKTILSDERLTGIISSVPSADGFDPASLDQALENIREQDESEMPALSVAEYANETGTCIEIILEKDGESVNMTVATAGQVTKVDLDVLGQLTLSMVIDQENKQFDLNASFAYEGAAMTLAGSLKIADERSDFFLNISMAMGETPITFGIKGFAAHEVPVFEAAEDLKVVALESMMGEDEASVEAANAFGNEFQTGLFAFVGAVMQQYPALYTLMMGGSGTSAE